MIIENLGTTLGSHFVYKEKTKALLRQKVSSEETMIELATQIYGVYFKNLLFEEATRTFIRFCSTVDRIRRSTGLGIEASYQANTLIATVGVIIGANLAPQQDDRKKLYEAMEKVEKIDPWMTKKLLFMFKGIEARGLIDPFIERITLPYINDKHAEKYALLAEELLQTLNEARKYGIKDSYFEDGILHKANEVWVVTDSHAAEKFYTENSGTIVTPKLANIFLAEKSSVKKIQPERVYGTSLEAMSYTFESYIGMLIDKNGQLFSIGGSMLPVIDLKAQFASRGKQAEYEFTRLICIMKIFDLIVPKKIIETMPVLPISDNRHETRIQECKARSDKKTASEYIIRSLIIPRIKILGKNSNICNEIEQEMFEDKIQTERRIGKHDVINHIRRLPPGYKASPEAREKCKEDLGIDLALTGETYVRRHSRGEGDQTIVYKAIQRD